MRIGSPRIFKSIPHGVNHKAIHGQQDTCPLVFALFIAPSKIQENVQQTYSNITYYMACVLFASSNISIHHPSVDRRTSGSLLPSMTQGQHNPRLYAQPVLPTSQPLSLSVKPTSQPLSLSVKPTSQPSSLEVSPRQQVCDITSI